MVELGIFCEFPLEVVVEVELSETTGGVDVGVATVIVCVVVCEGVDAALTV